MKFYMDVEAHVKNIHVGVGVETARVRKNVLVFVILTSRSFFKNKL